MSNVVNRAQDFMSIFMPSTDYIPSFLEENAAMLDTLHHSIDEDSKDQN